MTRELYIVFVVVCQSVSEQTKIEPVSPALAMTSLLLQIFPILPICAPVRGEPTHAADVVSRQTSCLRFPAPNRFQCRDYPPVVPRCCPSRDLVALAGSWASFPFCGESLSQPRCFPRLISGSMVRVLIYEHGLMRGIINIDKLDKLDKPDKPASTGNTKAKQVCPGAQILTVANAGLPRWEFHRALGDQVPSQFLHTWTRAGRGTRSRQS